MLRTKNSTCTHLISPAHSLLLYLLMCSVFLTFPSLSEAGLTQLLERFPNPREMTHFFSRSTATAPAAPADCTAPAGIEIAEDGPLLVAAAPFVFTDTAAVTATAATTFKTTPQARIDQVYDTLEAIDNIFRDNGIKYALTAGSQLGATRHGGIIPWDDDGDILVGKDQIKAILKLKNEFKKKGYGLRWWPGGYQVYPLSQTQDFWGTLRYYARNNPITGYKDAFVDIFPIAIHKVAPVVVDSSTDSTMRDITAASSADSSVATTTATAVPTATALPKKIEVYVYDKSFARRQWPKEYLEPELWENGIVDIKFGHLTLKGLAPANAKRYLNRAYGSNWDKVAYQTFDHENARLRERQDVDIVSFEYAPHSRELASRRRDGMVVEAEAATAATAVSSSSH